MVARNTLWKYSEISERLVLANSFSINMLDRDAVIHFYKVSRQDVEYLVFKFGRRGKEIKSIIGHESTAKLLSKLLGVEIPANREFYTLKPKDLMIVVQLKERLPEGVVLSLQEIEQKLKEGKIEFWLVRMQQQ